MRAAVALTLLLAACAHGKPPAPVSGPPATEPPQVLGMSEVRLDFTPSPPTTTTVMPPVVSTTAPQNMNVITTTVPTTAPPPAATGTYHPALVAAFGKYGDGVVAEAQAIAQCESQMNERAVSPTDDHGLMQLNRPSHQRAFEASFGPWYDNVYDPYANAAYAERLYASSGWGPWTCRWAA